MTDLITMGTQPKNDGGQMSKSKTIPMTARRNVLKAKDGSPVESGARKILESPYFFNTCLEAFEKAGLVGERMNSLVLFIVAVSRLLPRPICGFVKGKSSSGKNWLVRCVLLLFPRGRVREISSVSDKALNYVRDYFRHRVLFLQERDEFAGNIHPLRLLISEQKLVRTVASWVDGKRTSVTHVARGPVAAISTTTKSGLQIDDETRHLSIFVNESKEQTKRIVRAYTKNNERFSREESEKWHNVQRLLEARASKTKTIIGSWFAQIADHVFVDDVTVRRYFPTFVEACRTVCLIRSFQRYRGSTEPQQIEVEFADFAITALIFEKIFVQSLHRQEGSALEVRQEVSEISACNNGGAVQAEELAQRLGIPIHSAYAKLRQAVRAGTVRRVNDPEKDNRKFYLPAECPRFLPDPRELFQILKLLEDRVRFVHPITGDWVICLRDREKESQK